MIIICDNSCGPFPVTTRSAFTGGNLELEVPTVMPDHYFPTPVTSKNKVPWQLLKQGKKK